MTNEFVLSETSTFKTLCDEYVSSIPSDEEYQSAIETLKSTILTRADKKLEEIKKDLNPDVKSAAWTVAYKNIRYVIKFTMKNIYEDSLRSDFIQNALIACFDAALKYDFVKSEYLTFANNYLIKCRTTFCSDNTSGCSESSKYTERTSKIWKAYETYKEENGCEPTAEQLASVLKIKSNTVMEHLGHMSARSASSIHKEVQTKEGVTTVGEIVANVDDTRDPVVMAENMEEEYFRYYNSCSEMDRRCYELSMGINESRRPNTKIATELGISVDEVKLHTNTMKMLINEFFRNYGIEVNYDTNELIS